MKKQYPSIFTQVLGPVGPGPSSSSTCGMVRVGYLGWQLFGGIPKQARFLIPKASPTAPTLYGMRSDLALLTGMLGRDQRHPRLLNAYQDAREAGMEFSFEFVDWDIVGTAQLVGMELLDGAGFSMSIKGDSTGGGTCMIREIEGCPIEICADQYEILLFFEGSLKESCLNEVKEACKALKGHINEILYHTGGKGVSILEVKMGTEPKDEDVKRLSAMEGLKLLRQVRPVHPVVVDYEKTPPFDSAEGMIKYCGDNHLMMWEAAVRYEAALSGWSEKEVLDYAGKLCQVIMEAVKEGLKGGFDMNGIMTPKAFKMKDSIEKGKFLPMGTALEQALPAALGVMEYSNSSGTIVYLPTGGSSGIVPGVLYGLKAQYGAEDSELAKALLTAGIIGVCMAEGNNFSGCEFGCQAEVACASAMGSGAVAHFMGGNAKEACDAASMCLQSMLGLICDAVAGMVQVPCLARNITGAALAFVCANSVMAGFDVVIPLTDMVGALKEVGAKLIKLGMIGACTSPTGCRLAKEQEARNAKLRG